MGTNIKKKRGQKKAPRKRKAKKRIPTMDWRCECIRDANEYDGTAHCEFCGTRIRWVHVLRHKKWREPVMAGCCCAVHYCHGYDAANAEREYRNTIGRKMRFMDRSKWHCSKTNSDNIWRWVTVSGKRDRLTVFEDRNGAFRVYLHGHRQWECYDTQEQAMEGAFEFVDGLR